LQLSLRGERLGAERGRAHPLRAHRGLRVLVGLGELALLEGGSAEGELGLRLAAAGDLGELLLGLRVVGRAERREAGGECGIGLARLRARGGRREKKREREREA
jgi:hypothetical protein